MKRLLVSTLAALLCASFLHSQNEASPSSAQPVPTFPAVTERTDPEVFKATQWDNSQAGREIDLSQYHKTFNDDFKVWNIVPENDAPGPNAVWFAPGHGAYRKTCPLREDGPFELVEDGLRMRLEWVGKHWKGACITTVNTRGEGWSQQYGYFESTIRFDYESEGIWAAFWAKSVKDYFTGGTTTRTEIDFVEFYGDDGYHPTLHLWGAKNPLPEETILVKNIHASGFKQKIAKKLYAPLKEEGGGFVRGFHQYGGEITPEWIIMYFDRKEVGRFPTPPESKTPLFLLLTIVMLEKYEEKAQLPMDMVVRNVSAYLPNEPYAGE